MSFTERGKRVMTLEELRLAGLEERKANVKKVSDYVQSLTTLPVGIVGTIDSKSESRFEIDFLDGNKSIFGTDIEVNIEDGLLGLNVGTVGTVHNDDKPFIEMHRLFAVLFDHEQELLALINSLCLDKERAYENAYDKEQERLEQEKLDAKQKREALGYEC
jgi:hypothetical protein